jgi:hypothetical protein
MPAARLGVLRALAGIGRLDPGGNHRAVAERGRERAGHARSVASLVAADAIDAEVALALRRAAAGEAVVLRSSVRAAATVRRRSVHLCSIGSFEPIRARVGPAVPLAHRVVARARTTKLQQGEKSHCFSHPTPRPRKFTHDFEVVSCLTLAPRKAEIAQARRRFASAALRSASVNGDDLCGFSRIGLPVLPMRSISDYNERPRQVFFPAP